MYTQAQKSIFLVVLTSLLLQSCGNLALESQQRMTGEEAHRKEPIPDQLPELGPNSPRDELATLAATNSSQRPETRSTVSSTKTPETRKALSEYEIEGEAGKQETKEEGTVTQNKPSREALMVYIREALQNPALRLEGIKAFQELAREMPALARRLLRLVHQKGLVEAEERVVHLATLETFEILAKADPTCAPVLLKWLQAAIKDRSDAIGDYTISMVGNLIKATPALASQELREVLIQAAQNPDSFCSGRSTACWVLGELLEAAPELANQEVREVLVQASSSFGEVCIAACWALGILVKANPTLADATVLDALMQAAEFGIDEILGASVGALLEFSKVVPTQSMLASLLQALTDKRHGARYIALVALGELIKATPELATPEVREATIQVALSEEGFMGATRSEAYRVLEELIQVAPALASLEVFHTLTQVLQDEYGAVRCASRQALAALAEAMPSQDLLERLMRIVNDTDDREKYAQDARYAAITAIERLIKADPELASPAVLDLLLRATLARYLDQEMRHAIDSALVEVVSVAANQDMLERLSQALETESGVQHSTVFKTLAALIKANPTLASQGLMEKLMQTSTQDSYVLAYSNLALRELVRAMPHQEVRDRLLQEAHRKGKRKTTALFACNAPQNLDQCMRESKVSLTFKKYPSCPREKHTPRTLSSRSLSRCFEAS